MFVTENVWMVCKAAKLTTVEVDGARRRQIYDDERAPSRTLAGRLRKAELESCGDIKCGYCRYHRGENRTHTSPHADVRKRKKTRQKVDAEKEIA